MDLPGDTMTASRNTLLLGLTLSTLLVCVAPPVLWSQPSIPDVSGRWMGGLDISKPDRTVQHETAFFILKQDGSRLSGSAGATEHQQSEIAAGSVTESEIHFTITVRPGASVTFNLRLDGDHLKGKATGNVWEANSIIDIDTVRLKPASERIVHGDEDIFNTISRLDSQLYGAYNSRDFQTLERFFTKDMEFYHDKEGLTTFDQNMESFKRHFASDTRTRRELVEGTLEVYPMAGYGAVELGVHRFYTTEKGQSERLTATARFVHLWQRKDGVWKISRVISYDHR
jgi:ketosteroid isomerase-like protein